MSTHEYQGRYSEYIHTYIYFFSFVLSLSFFLLSCYSSFDIAADRRVEIFDDVKCQLVSLLLHLCVQEKENLVIYVSV